jgi:hypothetical protein
MPMADEAGAKPEDLDPAAILEAEKTAQDVEQRVAGPNYNGVREQAISVRRPDGGGSIMHASFDATATVPEYIRGTLQQLNGLQKFFHGRDVQKIQRTQVMKLTRELFEYQYKDMQHVLMLGMDVQKKTRFIQYLNATKSLQNRIQHESAEAQLAIIDTMFENRMEAFKNKNARDVDLERMHQRGILDKGQYERSKRDNETRIDEQVQRLDQTADVLIKRHTEFLYTTLELFKTKLIENGLL